MQVEALVEAWHGWPLSTTLCVLVWALCLPCLPRVPPDRLFSIGAVLDVCFDYHLGATLEVPVGRCA